MKVEAILETTDYIWTPYGHVVSLRDPDPKDIDIRDIAHGLARQCRYNGLSLDHLSVAEHSVWVSYICYPVDSREGLLHDAAEYLVGDMIRPIKRMLGDAWTRIEQPVQAAIRKKYGLPMNESPSVKHADNIMASTEMRDQLPWRPDWPGRPPTVNAPLVPWTALTAEREFLRRFKELFGNVIPT